MSKAIAARTAAMPLSNTAIHAVSKIILLLSAPALDKRLAHGRPPEPGLPASSSGGGPRTTATVRARTPETAPYTSYDLFTDKIRGFDRAALVEEKNAAG